MCTNKHCVKQAVEQVCNKTNKQPVVNIKKNKEQLALEIDLLTVSLCLFFSQSLPIPQIRIHTIHQRGHIQVYYPHTRTHDQAQ